MKKIITLFISLTFIISCGDKTQKSSLEELNNQKTIIISKMDSLNISADHHSKKPIGYKFIEVRDFPKTETYIINFELLDSNNQIIPASPIGGEGAITMKIVYPELAKRAGIEGNVWCEFQVDENGNPNDIRILKDIGGGCGEQVVIAITNSKFIPGKLLNKNINSNYRIAIQFKIFPLIKED